VKDSESEKNKVKKDGGKITEKARAVIEAKFVGGGGDGKEKEVAKMEGAGGMWRIVIVYEKVTMEEAGRRSERSR
ncbi:hypothetical protein HAX54_038051, partial [Datura stramonium]|nr:hypothetical protein [Datura stramonium]